MRRNVYKNRRGHKIRPKQILPQDFITYIGYVCDVKEKRSRPIRTSLGQS